MRYLHSTLVCVLFLAQEASARTWRDIQTYHDPSPRDAIRYQQFEIDPFEFSPTPSTISQTEVQPQRPTGTTSTRRPTRPPVETPSLPNPSPTRTPTKNPTQSPSLDPFPPIDPPQNPPSQYFNYDLRDSSDHGPGYPALVHTSEGFKIEYQNNAWTTVETSDYWDEFGRNGFGPWDGVLTNRNMEVNQCGNVGMQSPIDIRMSGVACVEHHQIRTRPGDFRVEGAAVQRRIESNKLRLVYQRRPCADVLDAVCAEPDPPTADFPNGWGGFADMMHVDFKLPAEHRLYGEVYDAEMQIFHLHPGRRRLPAISVLIKVDPNGYNYYLQIAIDAFQYEYNLHRAQCADNVRRNRQLMDETTTGYDESWGDFSSLLEDPDFIEEGKEHQRRMSSIWYPHHEALIPTYWFYGYDGSLTEPPCTEIVSWFVMDTPMIIAPAQLEQMKKILFTHVDENCESTSAHFHESVARPIQESSGRQVWRCTPDDFPPDSERTK